MKQAPRILLVDDDLKNSMLLKRFIVIPKTDRRVIIFFLTDRTDKVDRLHGFSLKGNDYIPKPFYPEELIARIQERFASVTVDQDKEYRLGSTVFQPNLSSLTYGGETHQLSVRETEILQMLADNVGRTVARDEILERIWGDASYSNSLALNVQITYIRRLLADPSVAITSFRPRTCRPRPGGTPGGCRGRRSGR